MERIVNVSHEGIPSAPFLFTCLGKVRGTRITSYFRVPTDLVARASRKHRVEREGDARALILLWGKKSMELFPSGWGIPAGYLLLGGVAAKCIRCSSLWGRNRQTPCLM